MGDGSSGNPYTIREAFEGNFLIQSGQTVYLKTGTYTITDILVCDLNGVTIKPDIGATPIIDLYSGPDFVALGNNLIFENIRFTSSNPDRFSATSDSSPADMNRAGVAVQSNNIEFRSCIFDNLRNLSCFSGSEGALFNGCLVFNNGWQGSDRGHGHTFYTQNNGVAQKIIRGTVFLKGWGDGVRCYGSESATLNNFLFEDCVQVQGDWLLGGDAPVFENITMRNCYLWEASLSLGFTNGVGGTDILVEDCIIAVKRNIASVTKSNPEFISLTFQNNKVYGEYSVKNIAYVEQDDQSGIVWNNNDYYFPVDLTPFSTEGVAAQTLAQWQAYHGFDIDSNISDEPPPTNDIIVTSLTNAGMHLGHVVIYNWEGLTDVDVDLTSLSLDNGEDYVLCQVQDYFNDQRSFTYDGNPLTVSMNGTQIEPVGDTHDGWDGSPLWDNTMPDFAVFFVKLAP